jgi:hypothetical protein
MKNLHYSLYKFGKSNRNHDKYQNNGSVTSYRDIERRIKPITREEIRHYTMSNINYTSSSMKLLNSHIYQCNLRRIFEICTSNLYNNDPINLRVNNIKVEHSDFLDHWIYADLRNQIRIKYKYVLELEGYNW